jgi:hypothetical protein
LFPCASIIHSENANKMKPSEKAAQKGRLVPSSYVFHCVLSYTCCFFSVDPCFLQCWVSKLINNESVWWWAYQCANYNVEIIFCSSNSEGSNLTPVMT